MNAKLLEPCTSYEALWNQIAFDTLPISGKLNIGAGCVDVQDPGATAIIEIAPDRSTRAFTYGELRADSNRLANALETLGIRRGDRVAVINPPSYQTALSLMTISRAGGVMLPISSLFGPDAIRYRLTSAQAAAVIVGAEHLEKVREALADRPKVQVIVAGDVTLRSGEHRLADLLDDYSADYVPVATRREDHALLIFTSGTTGHPKGVLHAQRVALGHLSALEALYDFAPKKDDVIWSPADWAWIAGLMSVLVFGLHHGVTIVVDLERRFDPERAIALMRQHRVTLSLLPATGIRAFRASDITYAGLALRAILSGGESLGAELLTWSESHFQCVVNEGYGQTELNGPIGNCRAVFPVKPGSLGRALPGAEVAVLDEAGERIVEKVGEIAVRRTHWSTMLGYWNDPAATEAKFQGEWLLTGDLGMEDQDGYFWFQSRKDDVITSSGFRIGPGEIEDCIGSHESVALVAVVGAPDQRRGEVPVAHIVLRQGFVPTDELAEELRSLVRNRLAAHEVPRDIVFRTELPFTATGKLQRNLLRSGQ